MIDVDRGGKITWHGPGQLVGYPIVRLPEPVDVVAHVRRLERLLIDALGEHGVDGYRVEGRSGVWVRRPLSEDKVAAIGVRVETRASRCTGSPSTATTPSRASAESSPAGSRMPG